MELGRLACAQILDHEREIEIVDSGLSAAGEAEGRHIDMSKVAADGPQAGQPIRVVNE